MGIQRRMRTPGTLFVIALACLAISARAEVEMLDEHMHASTDWASAVSTIHKDTDTKLTALDTLKSGRGNVNGAALRSELAGVQDKANLVSQMADRVRHENAKFLHEASWLKSTNPMKTKRTEAKVVGKMLNEAKRSEKKEQAVTNHVMKNLDSVTGTELGEMRGESLHTTPVKPEHAAANSNLQAQQAVLEAAKWGEGQKLYQKLQQMGGVSKALKGLEVTPLSEMEAKTKNDERWENKLEHVIGSEIDAAGKELNHWFNSKHPKASNAYSEEKTEADLGEAFLKTSVGESNRSPAQMAEQIRNDAMKAIHKLESEATAAIAKATPQTPQETAKAAPHAQDPTAMKAAAISSQPFLKPSVPHAQDPTAMKAAAPHAQETAMKVTADTGAFLKMEDVVSKAMRVVKAQEKKIEKTEKKHLAAFDYARTRLASDVGSGKR